MWSLHVLLESVWFSPDTLAKGMHVRLVGDFNLAVGVNVSFSVCDLCSPGFSTSTALNRRKKLDGLNLFQKD